MCQKLPCSPTFRISRCTNMNGLGQRSATLDQTRNIQRSHAWRRLSLVAIIPPQPSCEQQFAKSTISTHTLQNHLWVTERLWACPVCKNVDFLIIIIIKPPQIRVGPVAVLRNRQTRKFNEQPTRNRQTETQTSIKDKHCTELFQHFLKTFDLANKTPSLVYHILPKAFFTPDTSNIAINQLCHIYGTLTRLQSGSQQKELLPGSQA